jgi:GT2 family glycosyltransferase
MAAAAPKPDTEPSPVPEPARILAVIVLYHQSATDSPALRTLLESAARVPGCAMEVLLYDNAPDAPPPELPAGVSYYAASRNGGLAAAYNAALERAAATGCEWLLTLDCDTRLPADFLPAVLGALCAVQSRPEVAAVVPFLTEAGRPLSPVRLRPGTTTPVRADSAPMPNGELRAYNSAALVRVSAVREIGGFSPDFWLDYLDCWLHHELYRRGKRAYVVPGLYVEHQLSLLDYGERVTPLRFRNFQAAESAYQDLYHGPLERALYTARLAVRLWRQKRRGERPEIMAATRECLRSRILHTRGRRLQAWRAGSPLRSQEPA